MSKHGIQINSGDLLNEKYKVLSHIASGGMSEVYLVEEITNPDQQWAIKVSNMTSKLSRILVDETKILSELDHPTLPYVADFFSSDTYFYLVIDYIEGPTLADYFNQNNNKISIEMTIQIGIQICDVLHYLHRQLPLPIIYRDIKPGNLILKQDGTIKLIDFGIARKFQEEQFKDTVQIGTVGFAAPEQFEKVQSDTRTDIFSLGALLYYLISKGKYVYIAQKPIDFFQKGLPKSLKKCIDKSVKLNREDRLQDVRESKVLLLKAREEWSKNKINRFLYKNNDKWNATYLKYIAIILLIGAGLSIFYLFFKEV